MEVTVPPERWHFKINGHDIAVDATDPAAKLSTLYPELKREYEDQGYGELPVMGDLSFKNKGLKWGDIRFYQLWNMEGRPGSSSETTIEIHFPPSQLYFTINNEVLVFAVKVGSKDKT